MEEEREREQFLQAAHVGNSQRLLEINSNNPFLLQRLFTVSYPRETPLHVAILCGHDEFSTTVLQLCPALAESLDSTLSPPIHLASAKGCLEIVKALMRVKPEMASSVNRDGLSAVHLAAVKCKKDVLEVLLRTCQAAGRIKTNRNETILHVCIKYDRFEYLKYLMEMESFADQEFINAVDELGNTVLHLAVAYKQIKMVRYLVTNGKLNLNAFNSNGQTPLDVLSQCAIKSEQDWDIGNSLQGAGASIHRIISTLASDGTIGFNNQNNNQNPNDSIATPVSYRANNVGEPNHQNNPQIPSFWRHHNTTNANLNQSEWLSKNRDALMVVASLLAAMAFQAGVNPPGGVWQDNSPDDVPKQYRHRAGEAVIAFNYRQSYNWYLRFNTISFIASLSTLLLLISGLPLRQRTFMWILMAVMWLSIISMAFTYGYSILAITPSWDRHSLRRTYYVAIPVWCGVMGLLFIGHTCRLIDKWFKWSHIWRSIRNCDLSAKEQTKEIQG